MKYLGEKARDGLGEKARDGLTKVVPKFGKIRAVEIGFGGFVRTRQPISPATEHSALV